MSNILVQRLLEARKSKKTVTDSVTAALSYCGLSDSSHRNSPLRQALWAVVAAVEADGLRRQESGQELPYHNRSHVVDAVTALSCLMQAGVSVSEQSKWTALIAMVGHDLGHQGKSNKELQTKQEALTADWIVRCCLTGLSSDISSHVREIIELTDPVSVRLNHFAYRKNAKNERLLLQVLVNEADIAASLVPQLAYELTRSLLLERGNLAPSQQQISALYAEFKKQCILSSDAAQLLLSPSALDKS
jgi:hypothetical protein